MDMAWVAGLTSVRPIDSLKNQYELLELEGGVVVYAFTDFPKHYACPSCFAKDVIHALQYRRVGPGYFECPGCKTFFPIKSSHKEHAALAVPMGDRI